ncbi:MAG: hypothetical protein GY943_03975, partial [Chloroflexi bacterium]|nr:hypothetical protein [Chloroflexota bacterium]
MKASFLGILIVVLLIGCQSEVAEPIVVTRIVTEQVSITATPELVAVTRSITATPLPTATMEP